MPISSPGNSPGALIPHSRPEITGGDGDAVLRLLQAGMLAQGAEAARLEAELSAHFGSAHPAVAVGSGSAAVQLALLTLEVGPGDEVVLPTYLCRSVLQAVAACGASPILCDSGSDWVVTASSIAPRLSKKTKAIIVPHLYGLFADVAAIRKLGIPVIEDCCQALAAKGSREVEGDLAVLSFHPTKLLTSGEGGAVLGRSAALAERARALRDGQDDPLTRRIFAPLPDLNAALARSQLARFDGMLGRRRQIAQSYRPALTAALGSDAFWTRLSGGMFFRMVITTPGGCARHQAAFAAHGVAVRPGVDELMHRLLGLPDADYPEAVRLFETTLSVPLYPALTDPEVETVTRSIAAVLGKSRA